MYLFSSISLVFIFLSPLTEQINQGDRLPLSTYQELNYENLKFEPVQNTNKVNKRQVSAIDKPYLETNRLYFNAFNRETDLIGNNLDIEIRYSERPSEHIRDFFSSNYYTGFVDNEPDSYVVCYFEKNTTNQSDPIIFAQIHIKNDRENSIYYIEPLHSSQNLTYIIYKSDDVKSDVISNGVFNKTVCRPKYADGFRYQNESVDGELLNRAKRQDATSNLRRNRCYLALVADHRFFREIGNSDNKLTIAYMMNIVAAVNAIYTKTRWNLGEEITDPEEMTNFGLAVEKVIVYAEPTYREEHYNHPNSSNNADTILEQFGQDDWTEYCLAHLFTFRSFENSVLGLAYVSSPLAYSLGGICSMSTRTRSGAKLSVNTGLSSYQSSSQRQGRLLQREAELVTAHELGHNWGSEHDPLKQECTPSSSNGGNYIMYAYSNQGHERNNFLFSPCSINYISEVLKKKSTCFKPERAAFCGNDRIEDGEECDAGLSGRQGLDPCCDYNCKLKPAAECSDSNHYCCNKCKIAPAGFRCYSSSNYIECFEKHSYCNGKDKECPVQEPKPANTACFSYDQGKCSGKGHCLSLCQQQDTSYLPCKCPIAEEKCMICCRNVIANTSSECTPIHKLFSRSYGYPKYMTNGRPCYDGLCENNVCQQKVKDYVSRFWKVIQTVTVSGFVEFMKRNIVGSIIVISLTFWIPLSCCLHFCIDKKERSKYRNKVKRTNAELNGRQFSRLSEESFQRSEYPIQVEPKMRNEDNDD